MLGDYFLNSLTNAKAVFVTSGNHKSLSQDEIKSLNLLINNGHVLTQDQLLEVISEFYNNIINSLIVLISFLGVVAYISIRSLSRNHAEEIAEKLVTKEVSYYLSDDGNINKLLNRSSLIQDLNYDAEDRSKLINRIGQLESRIIGLEYSLMGKTESLEKNSLTEEVNGNNKKK
ncbi:MAG TPA: hypothetical protein DIV86_06250 [Alphaproteobacteria bacterium]|nr:hypothetical protein [Alphaproteobacteria bacterium]